MGGSKETERNRINLFRIMVTDSDYECYIEFNGDETLTYCAEMSYDFVFL